MPKKDGKTRSGKKPLKDISNKKKCSQRSKKKDCTNNDQRENDRLDRLLLIQSTLTTVVHQIDELVAQAFESKTRSKEGSEDIESFIAFLSEIVSSLKPWVPRLKKAFSHDPANPSEIAEQNITGVYGRENPDMGCLISPSPLVSWRADCAPERGRQLFLLTPLPLSKTPRQQHPSKSSLHTLLQNQEKPEHEIGAVDKPGFQIASPPKISAAESMLATTPSFKTSPPRSCTLLEPSSKHPRHVNKIYKSTPYCNRAQNQASDSSGSEISRQLALKYPDLLGVKAKGKPGRAKNVESSPNWSISPLKTCVLVEPPPSKIPMNSATLHSVINRFDTTPALKSTRGPTVIEFTPLQRPDDRGKLPGETTLKRELWAKFEAASTNGIRFNISLVQQTAQKGFLDRLEEASCDEKEAETGEIVDLR